MYSNNHLHPHTRARAHTKSRSGTTFAIVHSAVWRTVSRSRTPLLAQAGATRRAPRANCRTLPGLIRTCYRCLFIRILYRRRHTPALHCRRFDIAAKNNPVNSTSSSNSPVRGFDFGFGNAANSSSSSSNSNSNNRLHLSTTMPLNVYLARYATCVSQQEQFSGMVPALLALFRLA